MESVLVYANVLIDVIERDPVWADWSAAALATAGGAPRHVINPLVYAEVSIAFRRPGDVDRVLPERTFLREQLPWEAAFLAGKAFLAYRRRGGRRASLMPDFYIGAHAMVAGYRLLTRDRGRFESYFPTVELIAP